MEFKNRLVEFRELKEKTKEELAHYLDVTTRTYVRYETGERMPDLDTMKKLATYFECSLDYLVCFNQEDKALPKREDIVCYRDIVNKGYNGKLAHGLIKEIYDHQRYYERIVVNQSERVKFVTKEKMRQLLMQLLSEF